MATILNPLKWRKKHLENLIWSATHKRGLFSKKNLPKFKEELNLIKRVKQKEK
jgi:hypothetical protein